MKDGYNSKTLATAGRDPRQHPITYGWSLNSERTTTASQFPVYNLIPSSLSEYRELHITFQLSLTLMRNRRADELGSKSRARRSLNKQRKALLGRACRAGRRPGHHCRRPPSSSSPRLPPPSSSRHPATSRPPRPIIVTPRKAVVRPSLLPSPPPPRPLRRRYPPALGVISADRIWTQDTFVSSSWNCRLQCILRTNPLGHSGLSSSSASCLHSSHRARKHHCPQQHLSTSPGAAFFVQDGVETMPWAALGELINRAWRPCSLMCTPLVGTRDSQSCVAWPRLEVNRRFQDGSAVHGPVSSTEDASCRAVISSEAWSDLIDWQSREHSIAFRFCQPLVPEGTALLVPFFCISRRLLRCHSWIACCAWHTWWQVPSDHSAVGVGRQLWVSLTGSVGPPGHKISCQVQGDTPFVLEWHLLREPSRNWYRQWMWQESWPLPDRRWVAVKSLGSDTSRTLPTELWQFPATSVIRVAEAVFGDVSPVLRLSKSRDQLQSERKGQHIWMWLALVAPLRQNQHNYLHRTHGRPIHGVITQETGRHTATSLLQESSTLCVLLRPETNLSEVRS